MLAVCRLSIVRWILKNPLGNPLLIVVNLSTAATMSLQPTWDYRMNMLWYLWAASQYEKKLIYQYRDCFCFTSNSFNTCRQHFAGKKEEGISLLHLPRRRAALTWCEHANGLTSTATPGLHTNTHSTYIDTHAEWRACRQTFDTKTRCWQQQKQRWVLQSASHWQQASDKLQSGCF